MNEAVDYGLYYRLWHDESPAHRQAMSDAVLASISPWLPGQRTGAALDIGCGMGFAMNALTAAGFSAVSGVEVDRSQVDACLRNGLDVELIADLSEYLSRYENRWQVITMLDVLEHIPVALQLGVLRSIFRALAPGGRLILQVPNASSPLATRWLYTDFTHASSFTETSIEFALRNASFSKVEVPPLENRPDRPSFRPSAWKQPHTRWMLKRWLVRWAWRQVLEAELPGVDVSRIPLSLNLMAVADKDA